MEGRGRGWEEGTVVVGMTVDERERARVEWEEGVGEREGFSENESLLK